MSLLFGCAKKEHVVMSTTTYPISFVFDNSVVCTLSIPLNEQILYSDNSSYYEFASGTKIMATSTQVHTTERKDENLDNIYYTKTGCSVDIGSGCLTVKCAKEYVDCYKQILAQHSMQYVENKLDESKETVQLASDYVNKRDVMEVTENGNFMPIDTLKSVNGQYTADLITYDQNWCKSWIQDGLFEDIKQIALTYMTCANSANPVDLWYISPDNDIIYIQSRDAIFAAKALHYNSWAVYYTSPNFEDYVRTALDVIHAE